MHFFTSVIRTKISINFIKILKMDTTLLNHKFIRKIHNVTIKNVRARSYK